MKSKQKTPIILLRSLNINRGGITKASLKRANMLAEKYNNVIIVTTLFQREHKDIIKKLRNQGELSRKVKIYNFFDDMRGPLPKRYFIKGIKHTVKEKGFVEMKVDHHPHESYRYYKDGYYRMYKRFNDNRLQFIDYMDKSGQRIRREEFDEQGFLVRERYMDWKSNKPCFDRYLDYRGNCILSIHINPKTEKETIIVNFAEDKSYEHLYELQSKWMNAKIKSLSKPIIFTEFRGALDKITYSLEHPDIKKISVIHSSHLRSPFNNIRKIRPSFKEIFKQDKYDQYIFLTESQKNDIEAVYGRNNKYAIIPHVYNTNNDMCSEINIEKNNKLAVMVVRYEKDKRIDEAINAFRFVIDKIPDAKLFIYGKGSLHQELNDLIKELGLEKNIYLKGYTNNLTKVYKSAACSIITSRREGFGLVILESMNAGTPVIAYDYKYGPRDIIEDGINGCIVENGNKEELANKIIMLMTNEEYCNTLSKNGLKRLDIFNEEKYIKSWLEIIEGK